MRDMNPTIDDQITAMLDRAKSDPGIAFESTNVEFLAELRCRDRPAFETLRAKLKALGCRVTQLDKAIALSGEGGRGPAQSERRTNSLWLR